MLSLSTRGPCDARHPAEAYVLGRSLRSPVRTTSSAMIRTLRLPFWLAVLNISNGDALVHLALAMMMPIAVPIMRYERSASSKASRAHPTGFSPP